MFRHLSQEEIRQLARAIVDARLAGAESRALLMSGIEPRFVATFMNARDDASQVLLDLGRLNETERIIGGEVPFASWLENAIPRLGERGADPTLFEAALKKIKPAPRNDVPPPAALPPPIDIEALHGALVDAFPKFVDLEMMLQFKLGKRLRVLVGTGPMNEVVFDLIRKSEAENWTRGLIKAAHETIPASPALTELAKKYPIL